MEIKSSLKQLSCRDWKLSSNWDFSDTYIPNRNRLQKGRINQHIQPDMLNDFSATKSHDRNPDYVRVFIEECFKEMPLFPQSNQLFLVRYLTAHLCRRTYIIYE